MRLGSEQGDGVELEITGYQFPYFVSEPWDSNWLNIQIRAEVDGRAWTSHEPCLLTIEVEERAR